MTDKDIKDYCKNCDVEPPAMRFKCPECEYNPDKKPIDKMIELSEDLGLYEEEIIIDGVNVGGCKYLNTFSDCDGYHYYCDLADDIKNEYCEYYKDCYYKQLKRKTQEYEELKDKMANVTYAATGGRLSYSNYTLDAIEQAFNDQLEILSDRKVEEETKELNQKLYLAQNEIRSKTEYIQEQRDIIKKLEQECEELKKELNSSEKWRINAESLNEKLELRNTCYRKALEEIEEIAQKGLNPICYKSNCSRCQCYDGDDCNASMTSLINNYFTENGDFVDENCDFVEALGGLLEDERKKCNKAIPIAQQILDIINKAKGEE